MKAWIPCILIAAPLFAQVDLFTGDKRPLAAEFPPAPLPAVESALIEAPPAEGPMQALGEPSFVLVLGRDAVPNLPYPQGMRGYKGSIDWLEVPDLGFDKNEIRTITILKREIIEEDQGLVTFRPSLWHFQADRWETVYSGEIPYLEELMFLEDEVRVRLSSRIMQQRVTTAEGYRKNAEPGAFGFYTALNLPSESAVQKIVLVRGQDNMEMQRLRKALDEAPDFVPVREKGAPALADPYRSGVPAGVSLFEGIL